MRDLNWQIADPVWSLLAVLVVLWIAGLGGDWNKAESLWGVPDALVHCGGRSEIVGADGVLWYCWRCRSGIR